MSIICRFAPSPTGFLHVGNIRVAILNFLFCQKFGGKFILRFDDTDNKRVKEEYRQTILDDFKWLGISYDDFFKQSDNLVKYKKAKEQLIANGRLYECFESEEEIKMQRKMQVASGQRPIYNRAALNLTAEQKQNFKNQGRKPYYRFLLEDKTVSWEDELKGKVTFEGRSFSDPVLIRENGVPTYTFCSVVDDIEHNISHIMRGEDHITNTAIQIQIFQALGGNEPKFIHFPLIKHNAGKISKRIGGFDIKSLREEGFEPLAIINLLSQIGTSENIAYHDISKIIQKFDFKNFGKAAVNYDINDLFSINMKLISNMSFKKAKIRLKEVGFTAEVSELFCDSIKLNISKLNEIQYWYNIFHKSFKYNNHIDDVHFLNKVAECLPKVSNNENSWSEWINNIKKISDRKGKALFMPIRLALTGKSSGPELKNIIRLIDRKEIILRLR